jgi:hypothetical protein
MKGTRYINQYFNSCHTFYRTVAYRVLMGKPEGKRQLGRFRFRWKDNIKKDIQEEGWGHGLG